MGGCVLSSATCAQSLTGVCYALSFVSLVHSCSQSFLLFFVLSFQRPVYSAKSTATSTTTSCELRTARRQGRNTVTAGRRGDSLTPSPLWQRNDTKKASHKDWSTCHTQKLIAPRELSSTNRKTHLLRPMFHAPKVGSFRSLVVGVVPGEAHRMPRTVVCSSLLLSVAPPFLFHVLFFSISLSYAASLCLQLRLRI